MACLTSLASDMDVISDWFFFNDCVKNDRQYREAWLEEHQQYADGNNNGVNNGGSTMSTPYLIPPLLMNLVLASSIMGTILWIILATDGRIVAPILRRLGIDKMSMGAVLFLCVVLEDIPQVVLTFLIEDYYSNEDRYLSSFALWNVMASLYDTLIKLAEAYDERDDLVETGVWLRASVEEAHSSSVTAVLTLEARPEHHPPSASKATVPSEGRQRQNNRDLSNASSPEGAMVPQAKSSLSVEAAEMLVPTPTPLPRLQFLTASLDGSVKLWSCGGNKQKSMPATTSSSVRMTQEPFASCVRVFRGHTAGVTCLALLGAIGGVSSKEPTTTKLSSWNNDPGRNIGSNDSSQQKSRYYGFLSGCQRGTTKLWDVDTGVCLRSFHCRDSFVSSIAVVQAGATFVVGYQDGRVRLWDVGTGVCVGLYNGHLGNVGAICSLGDGVSFVTGSEDRTLRLWNTGWAMHHFSGLQSTTTIPKQETATFDIADVSSSTSTSASLPNTPAPSDESDFYRYEIQPIHEERNSAKIFTGHTDAIVSVACMESRTECTIVVSGSRDRTARLWSIDSGVCLRVFAGHQASVDAVSSIDEVTLLTGSFDTTVKVWDALTGKCLRTYSGHTAGVTGVSVTDDDTTFVTSSADRSVKIWVLTSVPGEQQSSRSLDDILDINDGLCRGLDPE